MYKILIPRPLFLKSFVVPCYVRDYMIISPLSFLVMYKILIPRPLFLKSFVVPCYVRDYMIISPLSFFAVFSN